MRLLTVFMLFASLMVTGCSWMGFGDDKKDGPETEGYTEEDFYSVIERRLKGKNYSEAVELLEALEAQFPFGDYAEQGQLELIFAHYKTTDYTAAIAAADRFIRLHPQHPNVDYAIYMKGLSLYAQSRGFITNFAPVDPTKRDPGGARDSYSAFSELVTRFPSSTYADDARKRMIYLRNLLARQEIHVANYYFKRGAYLAAANRGRYVVENFQKTPAVPDALAVMAQAYKYLGMNDLADNAVQTLALNYPEYPLLDKAGNFDYKDDAAEFERSWGNLLTLGLAGNFVAPPSFDTRYIYNPDEGEGGVEVEQEQGRSWLDIITFGLFD